MLLLYVIVPAVIVCGVLLAAALHNPRSPEVEPQLDDGRPHGNVAVLHPDDP
jgi:hypothetical protein